MSTDALATFDVTVNDQTVTVALTSPHSFVATIGGETVSARSMDELEPKLKRLAKTTRMEHAIPVVLIFNHRVTRATLRRKHATRRAYLLDLPHGSETLESPQIIAKGNAVSDEQIAALNAALRESVEAEKKYRTLLRETTGGGTMWGDELIAEAEKTALTEAR